MFGKVEKLSEKPTRNVLGRSLERTPEENLVVKSLRLVLERNVKFVPETACSRDLKLQKDNS